MELARNAIAPERLIEGQLDQHNSGEKVSIDNMYSPWTASTLRPMIRLVHCLQNERGASCAVTAASASPSEPYSLSDSTQKQFPTETLEQTRRIQSLSIRLMRARVDTDAALSAGLNAQKEVEREQQKYTEDLDQETKAMINAGKNNCATYRATLRRVRSMVLTGTSRKGGVTTDPAEHVGSEEPQVQSRVSFQKLYATFNALLSRVIRDLIESEAGCFYSLRPHDAPHFEPPRLSINLEVMPEIDGLSKNEVETPPRSNKNVSFETFSRKRGRSATVDALLSLLQSFVQLKESKGVERAFLTSLLAVPHPSYMDEVDDISGPSSTPQDRSIVDMLLNDLVMENENVNTTLREVVRKAREVELCERIEGEGTFLVDLEPPSFDLDESIGGNSNKTERKNSGSTASLNRGHRRARSAGIPVNTLEISSSKYSNQSEQGREITEHTIPRTRRRVRANSEGQGFFLQRDNLNSGESPLVDLVEEAVRPSLDLAKLQDMIRFNFALEAFRRSVSMERLWFLLTVYMNKLHAFELFIIEEIELNLARNDRLRKNENRKNGLSSDRNRIIGSEQEGSNAVSTSGLPQVIETSLSQERDNRSVISGDYMVDVRLLLRNINACSTSTPSVPCSGSVHDVIASTPPKLLKDALVNLLASDPLIGGATTTETSPQQQIYRKSGGAMLRTCSSTSFSSGGEVDHEVLGVKSDQTKSKPLSESSLVTKEWEIDLYDVKFLKRIGKGAAGSTYRGKWKCETVAIKVATTSEIGVEGWSTEVEALQRLHHPNVIRLLGCIYHQSPLTRCLVLEYCDGGDLAEALQKPCPPNFFFRVATGLASGLTYLHSRKVIHRDIKPANALIQGSISEGTYVVKLTDFGVATKMKGGTNHEYTAETGTYRWMAPEVIRHEAYSNKADVFSFSLLAWQLISHEDPFAPYCQIEAAGMMALEKTRPPFPDGTPPAIAELIKACWDENPDLRPSAADVTEQLGTVQKKLSQEEKFFISATMGHPVYALSEHGGNNLRDALCTASERTSSDNETNPRLLPKQRRQGLSFRWSSHKALFPISSPDRKKGRKVARAKSLFGSFKK